MAESVTSLVTASELYFDADDNILQRSSVSEQERLLLKEQLATPVLEQPPQCLLPPADKQLALGQQLQPHGQLSPGPVTQEALQFLDEPDVLRRQDTMTTLTMDEYAESLAHVLSDAALPLPLLMGILGPRGSGKTHLIKAMLWKMKGICSFSCSNMGVTIRPLPVRWRYNMCGSRSCQGSFFCYLFLLATMFFLLVIGVVAFTIYASATYTYSREANNGSSSTAAALTTASVTTVTPSVATLHLVNESGQEIWFDDRLLVPATAQRPQAERSVIEDQSVLYPLYAASAVLGFCLVISLLFALIYCCSQRSPDENARKDYWVHMRAILVMLLCETPPLPPPQLLKRQEIEVIPVAFNAYEYSGSDMLWAGIATSLFDQVEKVFGKWKIKFYRLFVRHTVPHVHDEHVAALDGGTEGLRSSCPQESRTCTDALPAGSTDVLVHSAKWNRIPYAVLAGNVAALLSLSILVVVLFAVKSGTAELATIEHAIQIAAGALFGLTVLTQVQRIWSVIKVFMSSQSSEVVKQTVQQASGPDFAKNLGFMHEVRREVAKVTDFVKLMERIYRKRFRILIIVDALDRCELPKIVNILEAVNVLLSDEESHFVTVLSVDHNAVNRSLQNSMKGNCAQYMQQLFQVRFCMPEYCVEDVQQALNKRGTANGRSAWGSGVIEWQLSRESTATKVGRLPICGLKEHADRTKAELLELQPLCEKDVKDMETLRQKFCRRLTKLAVEELCRRSQLLPLSYKAVRDLRNVIFCTMCMWTRRRVTGANGDLKQLEAQLAPLCRLFAGWIFLVEVWPYRCSWILHHLGVMEALSNGVASKIPACQRLACQGAFDNMLLSRIYGHVRGFVKSLDDWKYWISNDGDPDTFDMAIREFPLTVKLAKQFLTFTTNLDRGIKNAITDHCNMYGDMPCAECLPSTS